MRVPHLLDTIKPITHSTWLSIFFSWYSHCVACEVCVVFPASGLWVSVTNKLQWSHPFSVRCCSWAIHLGLLSPAGRMEGDQILLEETELNGSPLNALDDCFSNFNRETNYLEILLKCPFWVSTSGAVLEWGLIFWISNKLSGVTATSQSTHGVTRP